MLEFDTSTLANMTAALEHGCKLLPGEFDTTGNRKRVGDAIISAARSHKRSLSRLIEVAEEEVAAVLGQSGKSFGGSILNGLKRLVSGPIP
jgi:hypothetical protein